MLTAMKRFLRLPETPRSLPSPYRLKNGGNAAMRRARLFTAFVYGAADARIGRFGDPLPAVRLQRTARPIHR
jgi:hypothetical protein